jgi:hypothetical protein
MRSNQPHQLVSRLDKPHLLQVIQTLKVLLYLSIFSPAQPGPGPARARTAHGPYWTGLGSDLAAREKTLARARPKMLFLAILHYKNMGGPALSRPEKRGSQLPMGRAWAGFFRPEKPGFFCGPARARPGP